MSAALNAKCYFLTCRESVPLSTPYSHNNSSAGIVETTFGYLNYIWYLILIKIAIYKNKMFHWILYNFLYQCLYCICLVIMKVAPIRTSDPLHFHCSYWRHFLSGHNESGANKNNESEAGPIAERSKSSDRRLCRRSNLLILKLNM